MQLLVIAFTSWFVAQLVKFSIRSFNGDPDFKLFYQSGGMPSAHAATMLALATAALITQGYQSPIFGVAAVLAAIVIYDSLGVRRSSGEQSVVVNMLLKAAGNTKVVREVLGHTPVQVLGGGILGVVVALLFTTSYWTQHAQWLVATPQGLERGLYLAIFGGFTLAALVGRFIISRYRVVAVMDKVKSALYWGVAFHGLTGLFFSLLQFQTAAAGSWRLWPLLILVIFVGFQVMLWYRLYRLVPKRYRIECEALTLRRKQQRKLGKKAKASKKRRK